MKGLVASGLILAALIIVICVALVQAGNEFRATCKSLGGTPVHDGRQNVCLHPPGGK